jgi:hypothetical protein
MGRRLSLLCVLVAGLAGSAQAAELQAGAGDPARTLESSFTVALRARVSGDDACYPAPDRLVGLLHQAGLDAAVTDTAESAGEGAVYVIRDGTSCNNVRLALLDKGRLFILDSTRGDVRIAGRDTSAEDAVSNIGPLRDLTLTGTTFRVSPPNDRLRYEAHCPGSTLPLGGGLTSSPGIRADGEAFYPYSFERLGAQHGWHISGWLLDRRGRDATRTITVQVVCGLGLAPMSSPHATVFVRPGETKTAVATCPQGQYLMSGGYQRTDFLRDGGNYVTESRAIAANAWRVSGHAYGNYGGELTSIAYCVEAPGPLLAEVSRSAPLRADRSTTVTTPACPPGSELTLGGFSANGSQATFFAGGSINRDDTWSASGYGFFGGASRFTAYGYCLRPGSEADAVAANLQRAQEAVDRLIHPF